MKKLFIMFIGLLVCFLVSCTPSDAIEGYEEIEGRETIFIGLECAYAPFNWGQPNKTRFCLPIVGESLYADGYDIQIAKYLSRELNVNVRIKALSWEALINSLRTGLIDCIIAGMSPTEERKEMISFSDNYYTSTHVIVLKKNSTYAESKTLSGFNGARAIGQLETIYDSLLDQLAGIEHQMPATSIGQIVTALNSGTSDITILERPVAEAVVKANPSLKYIELIESFSVSEEDVTVSIGLRKSDTDLLSRINAALAKLDKETRDAWMEAAVIRQAE